MIKLSPPALWMSSLTLVAILSCPRAAVAAPAPIFQPLVGDIQERLPVGTSLRLPAYIPDASVPLYPYLKADDQGFGAYLAFKPNCQKPSCTIGAVGVLTQNHAAWPPKGRNRSRVDLTSDIQGYHVIVGQGRGGKANYVYWKQDGQIYLVGALELGASREEVIAIAQSMAQEPPIFSAQ